jgi:hypothetical protein
MLRRTLRGVGAFAPVVLSAGTLGAAGDLVLSPNQRLFVYQRGAERLADRAELLVRAGHLVDGDRVWSRPGGFIDWFTPVLDRHEILFAEGVPVESLEASPEILAALPAGMGRELAETLPDLAHRPHPGTEADPETAAAARSRLLRRDR